MEQLHLEILKQFGMEQDIVSVEQYGNGHINRTFLVTLQDGKRYLLQKINTTVFPNVEGLMNNIIQVTDFLKDKIRKAGGAEERETMTVFLTKEGKAYYMDETAGAWRVYLFIEHTKTYDCPKKPEELYESGVAVGKFQAMLSDFPAEKLYEILPDFHNTEKRYQAFEEAVQKDSYGRAEEAAAEIAFVRERRREMPILMDLLKEGELPLRVTHNDTKINNILFDDATGKGVCMIDLDTVMPGLAVCDFGDAIRSGANTAMEDEPDVSKVSLSLESYKAYAQGFLEGCQGRLTKKEIEMLPMGAKLMTLECGMRFLTDYLQGDVYFKTTREKHNLDRCRTQLALVADMEQKWAQLEVELVDK